MLAQPRQEREHLDRLSKAHVICQTRAEMQRVHLIQPRIAFFLIRAQGRMQAARNHHRAKLFRGAQPGEQLIEPRPVLDDDTQVRVIGVLLAIELHAQRFHHRDLAGLLVHRIQQLLQPGMIDLDPSSLQKHQPFALCQQILYLLRA